MIKNDSERIDSTYLEEIKDFKLLTKQEELELCERIKKGDTVAKETLINSNLKLVVYVAKKYQGLGLPLMDLIQFGNEGLMKAVNKFDINMGYKFSTYAVWWIRMAVTRGIDDYARNIRIPVHVNAKLTNYKKNYITLLNKLGHEPTVQEMKEVYNYTDEELDIFMSLLEDTISLNSTATVEGDCELQDFIEDRENNLEENFVKSSLKEELEKLLIESRLSLKERNILYQRVNEGKSLEEIARGYGVTRERIRQIETKAYAKIRRSKNIEHFILYAEDVTKAKKLLKKQDKYFKI